MEYAGAVAVVAGKRRSDSTVSWFREFVGYIVYDILSKHPIVLTDISGLLCLK